MRNLISVLSFCFVFTATLCAQAPEGKLQHILKEHKKSLGDQTALEKIKSMKMTGVISILGEESEIKIFRRLPNKCRIEFKHEGEDVVCYYDGSQAWMKTAKGDTAVDDPVIYAALLAMSKFDILSGHKSNSVQVKYLGEDEFEGKPVHKLQLNYKDEEDEEWFLDQSTFRLLKAGGKTLYYGSSKSDKTILYMDYEPVEGVYLPHYFFCDITTFNSEIDIEKIELNPQLDPCFFKAAHSLIPRD